eukprot:TRINITY_DN70841_c0_g1_i1.p1 TRINITY_DN70841_c0_g1~~TRINITY_DN70841_c0_g1_i1.p1  ORF type:complete len:604 (+),score=259.75 TRINITY_DN70841_c0_g1_i1:102-1913(+)
MYGGMGDEGDYEQEDEFGMEEYAMDDTLDPVTRLQRYCTSDFTVQRLVLMRELAATAESCGRDETREKILPLLAQFGKDTEPAVREAYVEQLLPLSKFMIGDDGSGYQDFVDSFLPAAMTLLVDKNAQVGVAALAEVVKLATLVKDEDVDERLIKPTIKLATNERMEDDRMVAAQLFNELAERLGKEHCEQTIIAEVAKLAEDQRFSVRRTVAMNLGILMKTVGTDSAVERLVPIWLKLSGDEQGNVRQACVDNIIAISQGVNAETRKGVLLEQYMKFREDANRWVKVSACQHLGEFIHTFDKGDISPELLSAFVGLAPKADGAESDYSECCAFAFPGVVEAVGPDRWGELEEAYNQLVKDVQWKVRRSLAYSLHELGKVLGPEISERVLTQAYDLFIRDLDEVQVGCLTNSAAFVACVEEANREKLVEPLCVLASETENWRLRAIIAQQLGDIASHISVELCAKLLKPAIVTLCEDHVSDVRGPAASSCAKVLKRLCEGSHAAADELQKFICNLLEGPECGHFQQRQMFVSIAGCCVREGAMADKWVPKLESCANDPCANVRISLAKVLADECAGDAKVKGIAGKLAGDKDNDVKRYAAAAS